MKISRVSIQNFRNFKDCDVESGQNIILVGENKAGKSNFIEALRIILDPSLSESDRQLVGEDFFDGDGSKPFNGDSIRISLQLTDFADVEPPQYLALLWLSDGLISHDPQRIAQIDYIYFEDKDNIHEEENDGEDNTQPTNSLSEDDYSFKFFAANNPDVTFNSEIRGMRKDIPLYLIKALRDIATDNNIWRRSPLSKLVKLIELPVTNLEPFTAKISEISSEVIQKTELIKLEEEIQERLKAMVGQLHAVDPRLSLAITTPETLLESLRIFVDGDQKRTLNRTSLGFQNILYLTLLSLLLQKQTIKRTRKKEIFLPIVALEEPEAHLHPHLQRLVFTDFLEKANSRKQPVIISTHSPHIASAAKIQDIILLKSGGTQGCKAYSAHSFMKSLSERECKDLERFWDITKAEMLFAKGVIFVEGDVEVLLINSLAEILGIRLDEYGISTCNTYGTHFQNIITLAHNFKIPFIVFTDGDKFTPVNGLQRGIGLLEKINPLRQMRLQTLYDGGRFEQTRSWIRNSGIFVNDWTFEPELLNCDLADEFKQTFEDLGKELNVAVRAGINHIDAYLKDVTDDNMRNILTAIDDSRWGKGRFAHRLIRHIQTKANGLTQEARKQLVPEYIKKGIYYIVGKIESDIDTSL